MTDAYRIRSPETWDAARADYLAGADAESVCARYDLALPTFRRRAREGGWRRLDQPDPEPLAEAEDDPDAPAPALPEVAALALRRSARAAVAGRVGEAARWLRLHRDYLTLESASELRDLRASSARLDTVLKTARAAGAAAQAQLRGASPEALDTIVSDLEAECARPDRHDRYDRHPVSRLDRERLERARDKARRRGQTARAAELQARLDAADP